jgi:hypothetical protein
VEHNADYQERIGEGIRMEYKCPIRLLLLGHQKEGCHKFDAQKSNEQQTGNAMKNPDKHQSGSFLEDIFN